MRTFHSPVCLQFALVAPFVVATVFVAPSQTHAAPVRLVICRDTSSGALKIRTRRCKAGEIKVENISQLTGPAGAAGTNGTDGNDGADGADGALRIYGDGSAGELVVSGSVSLDDTNLQYTNISIELGATLIVPSGTVLRATGTFVNNGTLIVRTHAAGAFIGSSVPASGSMPSLSPAGSGIAFSSGSQGGFGPSSSDLSGGPSAIGMTASEGRSILRPGPLGGGGGGAGFSGVGGGFGGGTVTVLAQGSLSNAGLIYAAGDAGASGCGGGGGGIVILASKVSVTNGSTGIITVAGGAGGASSTNSGAGGGGGGGLVHLIAPAAPTNSGTVTLNGGAAGSNGVTVSSNPRIGGGGGGPSVGQGGNGSNVNTFNSSSGNSAGTAGQLLTTIAEPETLL